MSVQMILEQALQEHEREQRRFHHALSLLKEIMGKDGLLETSWQPWVGEIVEAGEAKNWELVFELIMEGYRRILYERDPRSRSVPLVRTKEDWDKLPDRSFSPEIEDPNLRQQGSEYA